MKVTINDVVEKSGLSYATVSRAIRNDPSVKEKNRQIVLETMKLLGYVPSAAARTLVTGKTYVIAMLISRLGDGFYDSIIKETQKELMKNGYLLTLIMCDDYGENNISFLEENRVDGVILMVPNKENYYVDILQKQRVPFVVVDNQTKNLSIQSIQSDNQKGGYLAVKHLIDCGHKCIGLISADPDGLSSMERQLGAMEALNEANLNPYGTAFGNYDQLTGYRSVMKWVAETKLPTAIFAFDDHIALGSINAIKDIGLKVPQDISVCGYDDSLIANHYTPKITSIRQPAENMAKVAVKQLICQMNEENYHVLTMKLEPQLMVKGSTISI